MTNDELERYIRDLERHVRELEHRLRATRWWLLASLALPIAVAAVLAYRITTEAGKPLVIGNVAIDTRGSASRGTAV